MADIPKPGEVHEVFSGLFRQLGVDPATATKSAGPAETGWLIEHESEPKWLTLRPAEAMWSPVFTADSLEAIRFARRQDAEDYVACHLDEAPVRITEHMWPAPPAKGAA